MSTTATATRPNLEIPADLRARVDDDPARIERISQYANTLYGQFTGTPVESQPESRPADREDFDTTLARLIPTMPAGLRSSLNSRMVLTGQSISADTAIIPKVDDVTRELPVVTPSMTAQPADTEQQGTMLGALNFTEVGEPTPRQTKRLRLLGFAGAIATAGMVVYQTAQYMAGQYQQFMSSMPFGHHGH